MTTPQIRFAPPFSLPVQRAWISGWQGVRPPNLTCPRPAVKSFAGALCLLACIPLQTVAEQSWALPGGRQHRTAALYRAQRGHGATTALSAPFIRPIAPMPPLFADDELFLAPRSIVRLHRAPVSAHLGPATVVHRRQPIMPQADLLADSPPPPFSKESAHPSPSLFTEPPAGASFRKAFFTTQKGSLPESLSSAGMEPARAAEIQAALARFGYLAGAPTGSWDNASVAAMRKLQSDHHWQIKFAPDARALILLGLGPGS